MHDNWADSILVANALDKWLFDWRVLDGVSAGQIRFASSLTAPAVDEWPLWEAIHLKVSLVQNRQTLQRKVLRSADYQTCAVIPTFNQGSADDLLLEDDTV